MFNKSAEFILLRGKQYYIVVVVVDVYDDVVDVDVVNKIAQFILWQGKQYYIQGMYRFKNIRGFIGFLFGLDNIHLWYFSTYGHIWTGPFLEWLLTYLSDSLCLVLLVLVFVLVLVLVYS